MQYKYVPLHETNKTMVKFKNVEYTSDSFCEISFYLFIYFFNYFLFNFFYFGVVKYHDVLSILFTPLKFSYTFFVNNVSYNI